MSTLDYAEQLLAQRRLDEAADAFASCHDGEADRLAGSLWMLHMLRGDYQAAWQQSDGIRSRGAHDPHRFWNGESIDGKRLMVRCLHGFGDAVQMLRYLPLLQQRCAAVTVEVPPRMLAIAPNFRGMTDFITWGEHAPVVQPAWDVQVEVMELPYLFRTVVADLPIETAYVDVSPALITSSEKPRVGVVWSTGEWNRTRVLPFPLIERLTRDTRFEFWNLQGGPEQHAWFTLPQAPHLHDAAVLGDGILKLAEVIRSMDLVITADTLAAHLAGAMGKPAWVLLQQAADWRWMHARADSPWYPSLRLYRQAEAGDWDGVMDRVQQDLEALL